MPGVLSTRSWGLRGLGGALGASIISTLLTVVVGVAGLSTPPAGASVPSTGTTARASVTSGGAQASGTQASLSSSGRYEVFVSSSPLLASNPAAVMAVYRRDLVANTTVLVSVNPSGLIPKREQL